MLQNIKVDIIYYFTSTDFEMEFNLCGCCRMRLLTDKAADRKGFIHQLSRAVSRSRVIICCGPLFGDTGLIQGVATAIGKSVVKMDNAAYGIKEDAEIGIIEGSMPLVTSDGIFGGCIIESGPQAIVVLSESKAIRKNIMTSLIHPYIEELSVTPIKTSAPVVEEEESVNEEAVASSEETVQDNEVQPIEENAEEPEVESTEVDAITEEPEAELQEQDEPSDIGTEEVSVAPEIVIEAEEPTEETEQAPKADEFNNILLTDEEQPEPIEESFVPEDVDDGLYIEAQQVKFSKKHYYDVDYEAGADSYQYYAEPEELDYHVMFRIPIMIITVVLLIALLILAYLLIFVPMRDGYTFSEYIKHIFTAASVVMRPL